jgi:Flp pilus assembly pilin Flp
MSAIYRASDALKAMFNRITKAEALPSMVEYVMLIALIALALFHLAPNVFGGIIKVIQDTSSALQ